MWTKPLNPTVIQALKECRERRKNLSTFKAAVTAEGKACAWCLTLLKGRQIKWCSPVCGNSAFAWANPQSEEGLAFLLARQDYRCSACALDWNPLADSLLGTRGIGKSLDRLTTFSVRLLKSLKRQSPKGTKPEVDHIIPIAKGGQALGFDNHSAKCSTCHLAKTKLDNSGPRVKKVVK